jgi:hypothetical protein
MLRAVGPNEVHPCIMISPERVISMRFPDAEIFPFSGSAICRRIDRDRKREREREYITECRQRAEVDAINAGWNCSEDSICFLIDQQIKDAERRKIPKGAKGSDNSTQMEIADSNGKPLVDAVCDVATQATGITAGAGSVDGSADVDCLRREKKMSPRTKRKVREKIKVFFEQCRRHATFVTLTFIEAVSDSVAVRILNKFLTQLRKDQPGRCELLWVAERQNNNAKFPGNPHFHIIVNRRLDVIRYNSLWVLQQYNEGLRGWSNRLQRRLHIDEIRVMHTETMRLIDLRDAERNAKQQGIIRDKINKVKIGNFFNPFQIKKITNDAGLSFYLTKYVTKNGGEDSRGLSCALWHCTRGVSALFTQQLTTADCFTEAASGINTYIDKKTGQLYEHTVITNRDSPGCAGDPVFVVIIHLLNRQHFKKYRTEMIQLNSWIMQGHRIEMDRISAAEYYAGRFVYAEGVEYSEQRFSEN